MSTFPAIKLYGSEGCHKSQFYIEYLKKEGLEFQFLDVEAYPEFADELRSLYENGRLNYPTLTIGDKKLRNPSEKELLKWLDILIPKRIPVVHDIENGMFSMNVSGALAKVTYRKDGNSLFLVHSEVPYALRGKGIGKVLVEKTFDKIFEEGYKGIAVCSFIKAVARRNDKWKDLIAY